MKRYLKIVLSLLLCANLAASDHIDGPATTKHKVGDLTDLFAFPSPMKSGHMSLILNMYPVLGKTGHFSKKIDYRLIIKKVNIENGEFSLGEQRVITCKFKLPPVGRRAHQHTHHSHTHGHIEHTKPRATCTTSNGLIAKNINNVINNQDESDDFKLFVGRRSDPFFFNAGWAAKTSTKGIIAEAKDSNVMKNINVLSISIEIDMNKLFDGSETSLYAISAESFTQDNRVSPERILDRVGRPEVTNVSMVKQEGDDELRDLFNGERSFEIESSNAKLYQERLDNNISYFDGLDGKTNWDQKEKEKLVDILVDDFLVVDISKKCNGDNFLDIEKSLIRNTDHTSCGGRKLTDDIMDTLFTYYINSDKGERIKDGVSTPGKMPLNEFPYIAGPYKGFAAWSKTQLSKVALFLGSLFNVL